MHTHERLEPSQELRSQDRLIVALDWEAPEPAFELVDRLGDLVTFYKIGWRLFLHGGMELVSQLRDKGKKVFLDLKMDDIEETIRYAVGSIATFGASFLTLQGSAATARAAFEGRGQNSNLKLLYVTLLSSLDASDLRSIFPAENEHMGNDLLDRYVISRSEKALAMGCDGLIASGDSIHELRQRFPGAIIVSPGIRPEGSPADDHKRTKTPSEAIQAGADYLVVGRPIRFAANPVDAAAKIIEQIEVAAHAF
jgi:orotidine-5'-phosphate decarboxylase